MFDTYLIEVDEVEAGILLRQGEGFVFHAVAAKYRGFEGAMFPDPWSAERALRRQGKRRARGPESDSPGPRRRSPQSAA